MDSEEKKVLMEIHRESKASGGAAVDICSIPMGRLSDLQVSGLVTALAITRGVAYGVKLTSKGKAALENPTWKWFRESLWWASGSVLAAVAVAAGAAIVAWVVTKL